MSRTTPYTRKTRSSQPEVSEPAQPTVAQTEQQSSSAATQGSEPASPRLLQEKTLRQQITASQKASQQQQLSAKQKGKLKLPFAQEAATRDAQVQTARSKIQAAHGLHSREIRAFEWSLRTGRLLPDYNSEEDSAAQPNQEQADAELAANLALDEQAQLNQEQLHTFSQQELLQDQAARRELDRLQADSELAAKLAEPQSYADAVHNQPAMNTRGAAKQAAPEQNKDPRAASETGGSSGLSEEDRTELTKQQLQRSVQEATAKLRAFMKVKKTKEIPPQLQPAQHAAAVEPEQERVDYGDGEGYSSDEPPFRPSTKKSAAEPAAPAPKHAPQPAEKPAAGKPKHAANAGHAKSNGRPR